MTSSAVSKTDLTDGDEGSAVTTLVEPLVGGDEQQQQQQRGKGEKTRALQGAMAGTGGAFEEALRGLAGGVLFGLISPAVGHPFDTVKTRMQAETAFQSTGVWQTVRGIYRADGLRGFYRGFLPPLIGSMAYRGVLFSAYGGAYAACDNIPILSEPVPYTGGLRPSVLVGAFAAALARASIESPLDFVKVRYMVGKEAMADKVASTSATASSAFGVTTAVGTAAGKTKYLARVGSAVSVRNVLYLYKGFSATFLRTLGLIGSFFVMVDYSVRFIPDVVNAPKFGPFFKGGVCATLAWVFAFPFETAKSVIQADTTGKYKKMNNSTFLVLKDIYQQRGIVRGFYRGFAPGASRSFVANGISMTVYAWFQDEIRK